MTKRADPRTAMAADLAVLDRESAEASTVADAAWRNYLASATSENEASASRARLASERARALADAARQRLDAHDAAIERARLDDELQQACEAHARALAWSGDDLLDRIAAAIADADAALDRLTQQRDEAFATLLDAAAVAQRHGVDLDVPKSWRDDLRIMKALRDRLAGLTRARADLAHRGSVPSVVALICYGSRSGKQ